MRSFNKNYMGARQRTGLKKRWIAIRLTLLIMSLLLACLLLLIMQGVVLKWLGITNVSVLKVIAMVRWAFIISLIFYSIDCFFYNTLLEKRLGYIGNIVYDYITAIVCEFFDPFCKITRR